MDLMSYTETQPGLLLLFSLFFYHFLLFLSCLAYVYYAQSEYGNLNNLLKNCQNKGV